MIPAILAAATGLSSAELLAATVFGCFTVNRVCDSLDKKKEYEISYGKLKIKARNDAEAREAEEFVKQGEQLNRLLDEWKHSSSQKQKELVDSIFKGFNRVATPEMKDQLRRMTSTKEQIEFINQIYQPNLSGLSNFAYATIEVLF